MLAKEGFHMNVAEEKVRDLVHLKDIAVTYRLHLTTQVQVVLHLIKCPDLILREQTPLAMRVHRSSNRQKVKRERLRHLRTSALLSPRIQDRRLLALWVDRVQLRLIRLLIWHHTLLMVSTKKRCQQQVRH